MRNRIKPLIKFVTDADRKSLLSVWKDLKKLKKYNKISWVQVLFYYFNNIMYKKNAGYIFDYVNQSQLKSIGVFHTENEKHSILEHKIRFTEFMKENNIPTAKYIGKIESGVLIRYNGTKLNIENNKILSQEFSYLMQEFKVLFVKEVDSEGGKGVFKISSLKNLNNFTIDVKKSYLIEKGLSQHTRLNEINSDCINTLRVVTLRKGNNVQIPNSLLRIGINRSSVDNASSGGIFVNYNIFNNELDNVAYSLFSYGSRSFYKHPNTGFSFKGNNLPYPEQVIELVTRAALAFPDKQIIGWDIAYTPEGPVIVEGNDNPSPLMTQIAIKGFRNNEIYRHLYKDFIQ